MDGGQVVGGRYGVGAGGDPASDQTDVCNDGPDYVCPELGPWSDWSDCSLTCNGGKRSRDRTCGLTRGDFGDSDNPCKEPLTEEEDCNEDPCPEFGPWSGWTTCSQTCGGGTQERNRNCVPYGSTRYFFHLFLRILIHKKCFIQALL